MDGFAALDRGGLTGQLDSVLAFLDDDAALQSGAAVVAATVTKGLEQLVRWTQLDDARVLRLNRRDAREAHFGQHLAEFLGRFGLDHDSRDVGVARPRDEAIDRFGRRRDWTARDIRLARRADLAHLNACHRATRNAHALHCPAGPGLDVAPRPRLPQRRRRRPPLGLRVPTFLVSRHVGPDPWS